MSDPGTPRGPVLIEYDDAPGAPDAPAHPGPSEAPPVPEPDADAGPGAGAAPPTGLQAAARLGGRPGWRLGAWAAALGGALLALALSVAAWEFVAGLLARAPALGAIAAALGAAFLLVLLALALRELLALRRLGRTLELRSAAEIAHADGNLGAARSLVDRLAAFYGGRQDTAWGRERLAVRRGEILDADGLLELAERELLGPLDIRATREVEAAARQVATVTALVPLALADVAAALLANLRMIRRIAEIYGGRSGTLGSWRLTRAVLTHLVATGAVAVGDDLIHSVAGGSVLSRISRRFGEGVVNGALTARVGVAAMEVCRPLPFRAERAPSVTGLVRRALAGLFGAGRGGGEAQEGGDPAPRSGGRG